ncbi:hypothetical protein HaLaN_12666, partial [Haematococcus lacustris]
MSIFGQALSTAESEIVFAASAISLKQPLCCGCTQHDDAARIPNGDQQGTKLLRRLFRLDSDAYYIAGQLGSRAVPLAEINRVVGVWGDIVASFIQ